MGHEEVGGAELKKEPRVGGLPFIAERVRTHIV